MEIEYFSNNNDETIKTPNNEIEFEDKHDKKMENLKRLRNKIKMFEDESIAYYSNFDLNESSELSQNIKIKTNFALNSLKNTKKEYNFYSDQKKKKLLNLILEIYLKVFRI